MGSKQITLKEGASLNQPPLFEGEHFFFGKREWKSLFNQLIPVHGMPLLNVFFPTKELNYELVPKEWDQMKDDEKRKVWDDKKAKNIFKTLFF